MQRISKKVLDNHSQTALTVLHVILLKVHPTRCSHFTCTCFDLSRARCAFESFVDPFIIMLTFRLRYRSDFFTLVFQPDVEYLFANRMIMLIGLVTKNGILIVELRIS